MLSRTYLKSSSIPAYCFKRSEVLLQPVSREVDGILTNSSDFLPFDFSEGSVECQSSLYSIGNLQNIGAFDKLKTTFMCYISDFGLVDRFENIRYVEKKD